MSRPVSLAPLATFRITFGLLMFGSLLRFWARGWIESSYVMPGFHFTYQGFGWVQPLGTAGMHLLFGVLIVAALLIALGLFYRPAIVVFFLGFTYVELIDVTTYLNHYYFISLVAFPAHLAAREPRLRPRRPVLVWCSDAAEHRSGLSGFCASRWPSCTFLPDLPSSMLIGCFGPSP